MLLRFVCYVIIGYVMLCYVIIIVIVIISIVVITVVVVVLFVIIIPCTSRARAIYLRLAVCMNGSWLQNGRTVLLASDRCNRLEPGY